MNTIKGSAFTSMGDYQKHMAQKEAILNPPPPKPKIEAIRMTSGGKIFDGKIRAEGEVLLIWPDVPHDGFIKKEDAGDLIENRHAVALTENELIAFIEAQKNTAPNA